jgi:hypothetical protein
MTLVVVAVVIVGLLVAALDIYLFMIAVVLNRIAGNLGDCGRNGRSIAGHAQAVGPSIKRLNKTAAELLDATPLLIDDADGVAAKLVPSSAAPVAFPAASTLPRSATRAAGVADAPDTVRGSAGLMDAPIGVGYRDV